ncbi:hypothetical protein [Dyadobacter sp. CY323]|uniref:hypothetical protein n=1 Tax=Dyadobacter sp. CY323 TaxID=2907302 RepID=UPI001F489A71|nr:hypothetical protein [Dyadobacter sp. CY323]MCE6988581.1 hypothetical protein [Dyadobacter sp. CY323]
MKLILWLSIICAAVLITYPIYHYAQTYGLSLPTDRGHLGTLGDFMNVWVSAANLLILTAVTLYIWKQGAKEDLARERPLLILKEGSLNNAWAIQNVGKGAAINIIMSYKKPGSQKWEIPFIKLFSLAAGESYEIKSFFEASKIGLKYTDISKNVISSLTESHDTEFQIGTNIFGSGVNQYVTMREWDNEPPIPPFRAS